MQDEPNIDEPNIDALVRRVTAVFLPLSVTVLDDGRVAIVEGHGDETERVVRRAPDSDDVFDVRGGGVRKVLGSVGGSLLAEAVSAVGEVAVVTLPSFDHVAELAVGEVPCVVGSQLCSVSPDGIRFLSYRHFAKRIGTDSAGDVVPSLVQPVGSAGLAWVVGGPAGFHLWIVSWSDGDFKSSTIAIKDRPQEIAISPLGQRVALVAHGQVLLVENNRCVEVPNAKTTSGICWLDEERLCWVTRHWPDSVLVTHSFADDSRQHETFPQWTLGRLYRSGDRAAAVATRHRMPPIAIETAQLTPPDDFCPQFSLVDTCDGPLRTITFRPAQLPHGLVILLRGGPYGEWLPGWDPIVEAIQERGWAAVQLESPYTAAVRGRVRGFRRGQFGTRDAALVAAASQTLLREFGLNQPNDKLAFIGHSYGAFLASRAVARFGTSVAGLITMNGPWTTADLLAMGADPATTNDSLTRFLRQAFAGEPTPSPDDETVNFPKSWGVIYGTADTTAFAAVTERAIARDNPAAVLRLPDEPHIARRRESIGETIRFVDTWLRGVGAS